jgi:hypothetical protein
VTVNNTKGQNNVITFTGSANQRIALYVNSANYPPTTFNGSYPTVSIFGPAGAYSPGLTYSSGALLQINGSAGTFGGAVTLPAAGLYSVVVDPGADSTGSMTLSVYNVPPDFVGNVRISSSTTETTSTPGQNASITFSANVGQHLSVSRLNNTYSAYTIGVTDSFGNTNFCIGGCSSNANLLDLPYPLAAGTYTIQVTPTPISTGSLQVTLNNAQDNQYSIEPTATGSSVVVSNSTLGQNDMITFVGVAGHRLTIARGDYSYGPSPATIFISIFGPAPSTTTVMSSKNLNNYSFFEMDNGVGSYPPPALQNGTYTILVDP